MATLFNEVLYRPLFNSVVYIYNLMPGSDLGVTIIILTVIIRILFLPLSLKTIRSQKLLKDLAPKIAEIKAKFKNDTPAQTAATLKLYKDNKANPLGGCLPLVVQLPILIALYQVFVKGITPESLSLLYSFVQSPEVINKYFLGTIDVTKSSHVLTIVAGGLQFLQAKQSITPDPGGGATPLAGGKEMAALSKQMLYFFPIMIIIIGWNLPAGLILHWVVTTIFSIFEQGYIKARG